MTKSDGGPHIGSRHEKKHDGNKTSNSNSFEIPKSDGEPHIGSKQEKKHEGNRASTLKINDANYSGNKNDTQRETDEHEIEKSTTLTLIFYL